MRIEKFLRYGVKTCENQEVFTKIHNAVIYAANSNHIRPANKSQGK